MCELLNGRKDKASSPTIAVVSDTCIGYGSPQIPSIALSLAKFFHGHAVIFDSDQPERPECSLTDANFPLGNVCVVRQQTKNFFNTQEGHEERSKQLLAYCEEKHPEVLVIFGWRFLNELSSYIKAYTPFLILYALEHSDGLENGYVKLDGARNVARYIDLIIFPERNRAKLELPRIANDTCEHLILHNSRLFDVQPSYIPKKNGFLFYGGRLRKKSNYGEWFLKRKTNKYPIDIYGPLGEFDDVEEVKAKIFKSQGRIKYFGYVPTNPDYFEKLSQHAFSIVLWSPTTESTQFACPNKIYDALACSVPIISGPTPLAIDLVERFNCGLISPDWSYTSFLKTLEKAKLLFESGAYRELVEGCQRAYWRECEWNHQFSTRVQPVLTSIIKNGSRIILT